MVGFSDDLKSATVEQTCNVRILADEMGETDGDDFLAAIDSPEAIPTDAILRAVVLGNHQQKVGIRSVKNHRKRLCPCFTEITT